MMTRNQSDAIIAAMKVIETLYFECANPEWETVEEYREYMREFYLDMCNAHVDESILEFFNFTVESYVPTLLEALEKQSEARERMEALERDLSYKTEVMKSQERKDYDWTDAMFDFE